MSEWTSRPRLERHCCRPNISTQTGHSNSDRAGLHRTSKPRQPQGRARHAGSDQAVLDKIFKRRLHSHSLGPDVETDTGNTSSAQTASSRTLPSQIPELRPTCRKISASSGLTSQLRLDGFRQDLQVQHSNPQSQSRRPRSGCIPTQI